MSHPEEMAASKRPDRSYENLEAGQQLYRAIDTCTDPRNLYGKIESGHWDWLGVQDTGKRRVFLVGRPRRSGLDMLASFTAQHSNVETGRHRVSIRTPHPVRKNPDQSWWPTAEEARAEFERKKDELQNGEGSGLYKLSLYIDDELVDEEFVVRALHNRLYRPVTVEVTGPVEPVGSLLKRALPAPGLTPGRSCNPGA